MNEVTIRPIQPVDNLQIAAIIRGVFDELDAPKTGTAYADPALDNLSEAYTTRNSVYFIAEFGGKVVGGAGIAQLENGPSGVCELQKMYVAKSARSKGIGARLITYCLSAAAGFGYSQCYLETLPYMEDAQKLYRKFSFKYLDAPMGNTGHSSCPIWMLKDLATDTKDKQPLTINEYKKTFIDTLSPLHGADEAESFFYISLEELKGMRRVDLIMNPDAALLDTELKQWDNVLEQLKAQKPVQYIFSKAYFYGLEFRVDNNTLIPRPETEELVEWIINENKDKAGIKILDIGTGSGCIAVSLAKNLPGATVHAIDVSEEALAIANENALANGAAVHFILMDILLAKNLPEQYDVIVSNPPYVRNLEKEEIKPNVLDYEPHLALFVDDNDPLVFYRKIAQLALNDLRDGDKLYYEINQYLGAETVALLEHAGFTNIQLKKDLMGNDRMISCSL